MGKTLLVLRAGQSSDDSWADPLEEMGFTVLYAEEATQASVHLRTSEVDCVIIDSCAELSKSTRAFAQDLGNEAKAPPLVLLSSSPLAPSHSAEIGAVAFVPKPCNLNDLSLVLAQMSPSMAAESTSARA